VDFNPFRSGRATQQTVLNEDPAHYARIAKQNAAQQAKRDAADPEAAKRRKDAQAAIAKKKPVRPADIGRHSSQGGGFIGRRNESIDEISKDKVGAYLKKVPASSAQAGDMMARPTPGAPGSAAKMDKGVKKFVKRTMGTKTAVNKLTGKAKVSATEGTQYVIPEEIPANERTAFHGAAAAAAKAGKKSFNFGGKSHPVTMKKDTAKAISDDVKYPHMMYDPKTGNEVTAKTPMDHNKYAKMGYTHEKPKIKEGMYKDMDTEKGEPNPRSDAKVKADFKKRRNMKKEKAAGGGKEGDVEMNPKMDSGKSEQKESKIRSALKSVLAEKKHDDHYKSATEPEMMKDKLKGKGAEDMMKGAQDEIAKGPDAHLDEPEMIKKDRAKMTSNVKKSAMRKTDNPKGDTNIVPGGTPMKDPAAMKAESYDKMSGLKAAYASMYETVEMHNKMASAHSNHGNAHESEVTNGGHDDHDHAGGAHHDASDAHKAASAAHKKHGGNSSEYKSAAAKAASATANAKEQSRDAGKFKHVAKPPAM